MADDSSDLQFRLCIIGDTNAARLRGAASTESTIPHALVWSALGPNVRQIVKSSIHCIYTIGGGEITRPFGPLGRTDGVFNLSNCINTIDAGFEESMTAQHGEREGPIILKITSLHNRSGMT